MPHLERMARTGLTALLLLALGCGRGGERWNVVLVTFDTTRADHIGCYGHDGIATPHLDALAADGVRFARAFTAVPITAPSHSTILTGKYPLAHGFRDNAMFVLGDGHKTLAEVLREHGYATAAAVASFPLLSKFGLDQGFDLYDDHLTGDFENLRGERVVQRDRLFFDERRAGQVNEALYPWLDEHHERPFFLWAHYFDPHQPTEPPPPYDQLYLGDPYSGEIAYADEMFGQLMTRLRELGVYDRTLVVLAADHGEGLDEHGESTHSILLYNSTLHVPLIVRVPGARRDAVVDTRVGTVDIVPTVLDLLGIEAPQGVQGRSLAPAIRGTAELESRPQYAETLSPRLSQGWGELRALFDGDDKLLFGPRPELFDIVRDPRELDDRFAADPERAKAMQRDLARFLRQHADGEATAAVELDDETRQRLMALGYIHSSAGTPDRIEEVLRRDGEPPQDHIGGINDFSHAKGHIFNGRFLAARDLARGLLADDPENLSYLEVLATAEIALGRLDAAAEVIETLRRVEAPGRLTRDLLGDFAAALSRRGEPAAALERIRQAMALEPSARGHFLEASILAALDRRDEQEAALGAALALDPLYVPARVELAIRRARAGDRPAAEEQFRRVLADEPYFPRGHFNYGAFLVEGGDAETALGYFERAVELQPTYWQAHRALIAIYADTGRRRDAEAQLAILERRAPPAEVELARRLLETTG